MKALTWKAILQNLCEANGELKDLHCHLHYLEFGDVPEDYNNSTPLRHVRCRAYSVKLLRGGR